MSYISEPYTPSKRKIKVQLDLSYYATKSYLKNTKGVDTSDFTKKIGLAILKPDIDKLATTPVDLSKLGDVVENEVVKKYFYDKLI